MSIFGLKKSGITAQTPKNLMLGAGTYYKNLKWDTASKAWTGIVLGATSGGGKCAITSELVDVEIDGASVKVKGMTQKVGETASIEANMVEITPGILKMAIIGKDGESEADGFDLIQTKPLIEEDDYLENISFVGFLATNKPVIIILENALCTSGLKLSGKNKENVAIAVTFECFANFDEDSDHDVLPVRIYYPSADEPVPAPASMLNSKTTSK